MKKIFNFELLLFSILALTMFVSLSLCYIINKFAVGDNMGLTVIIFLILLALFIFTYFLLRYISKYNFNKQKKTNLFFTTFYILIGISAVLTFVLFAIFKSNPNYELNYVGAYSLGTSMAYLGELFLVSYLFGKKKWNKK